jgi:hypothetical protein
MTRSYGGKLGVWLTGKKRKVILHRNPVSKKRSFRKSIHMMGMGVSGLPAKFKRMQNVHQSDLWEMDRGAGVGKASGLQDVVGWDDVRCRPVYYKSNANGGARSNASKMNAISHEHNEDNEISKMDGDNFFSGGTDHNYDDDDKENINPSVEIHHDENVQNTLHRPNDNNASQFLQRSIAKGNKKQAYGNQKRRGRLLSSMATSVLEQCASPIPKWESYNYNKSNKREGTSNHQLQKKRKRVDQSRSLMSTCTDDSSTLSFSSMKTSLSSHSSRDDYEYTPPRPVATTVCLDSKTSDQDCASNVEKNSDKDVDVDGEVKNSEMDPSVAYSALQVPQDIDGPPRSRNNKSQEKGRDANSSAPTMNLKPRIRKINIKEKRKGGTNSDGKNGCISTNNGSSQKIRQPTCSTSLLAAKAFFDHLDATHVLKIE